MNVETTLLKDVLLIKPDIFEDHRGQFVEIFNKKEFEKCHISVEFIQDDISTAAKNVLKGIHGDFVTKKLVSCLFGKLYFIVLDYNRDSKSFGEWQSFILSDRNRYQILIPPGFGNGFLSLEDNSIFSYKQSTYYDRSKQFTIKYNDDRFNIFWPCEKPILSLRDL
jgi:dTDP-4-dehydrorhamnose 3,5-epimerase